jgi:peptidoglycan L-alanyl-D-glutamate endopeptidase CwlK
MDKPSQQRIALLHPAVRQEVDELLQKINTHLSGRAFCRIAQGLRTIEEQDALYAQGRSTKGKIVTNARGGSSYHNYGLAVDFVLIIDGKEASWDIKKDWDGDGTSDWMEVVKIFKGAGWKWGGEFRSLKDYPHFEKSFGYTVAQLFSKYKAKDFIEGTKYVKL